MLLFSIISVNVRGLREDVKRRALFDQCRIRADITCFQETHGNKSIEQQWINEWGGRALFSHGSTQSRGVGILFKKGYNCNITNIIRDYEGRWLICEIELENGKKVAIINIYAPNTDKPSFFDSLSQTIADTCEDRILVGDFNLVLNTRIDRLNSKYNNYRAAVALKSLMKDYHMCDIWRERNPTAKIYSWNRKTVKGPEAGRLDYILATRGIDALCENIMYVPTMLSDHCPIFAVFTENDDERGPGYWKFNSTHLKKNSFTESLTAHIQKDLEATKNMKAMTRWETMKKRLQKFLKQESRKTTQGEKEVIGHLAEVVATYELNFPLNEQEYSLYEATKIDLNEALRQKSKGLIFRSKAKWYGEGEENTKYFFALEKAKSNAKNTRLLLDAEGQPVTGNKNVLQLQKDFYQNLYKSNQEIKFQFVNSEQISIPQGISAKDETPFNLQELTAAVKAMKFNKAPGPDGLTTELYQFLWPHLGSVLLNAYNEAFQEECIYKSAREGVLNLIPKPKKDSRYLKNLRPITLLNVDYKIVEKALASRLYTGMEYVINNDQTGFMEKRRMAVNIRKLFDVMDYCSLHNKPGIILSLDYMKAFDMVEVGSVISALKYFGFSNYLVKWVEILYYQFTVKIQNNGYFSQEINVERSVHQGGCASAFLFNLVVEILAIQLRKDERIKPIKMGNAEQLLNQYADDADVASDFQQQSLDAILEILDTFRWNTGLTVSYEKTSIYRIGSLKDSNAELYTQKPIAWTNEGLKVLGINVVHQNVIDSNYAPCIQKAVDTMKKWCNRNLSLLGKVKVVNTLIASLFVHKFTTLPSPTDKQFSKLQEAITAFIWNGKKAKIKTSYLHQLRENAGLQLANLKLRDISLKCTWIQILNTDPKYAATAFEVFCADLRSDIFKCNLAPEHASLVISKKESHFWHDMLKAWCTFNYNPCGDAKIQTVWWNSNILVNGKPIFLQQCYNKGLLWIHQLFVNGTAIGIKAAWEVFNLNVMHYNSIITAVPKRWRNELKREEESHEELNYLRCLEKNNLSWYIYADLLNREGFNDSILKRWEKDLKCDVVQSELCACFQNIYVITNNSKLRSLQYKMLHRAVVLNTHLVQWKIKDDELCSICQQEPETLYHFFFDCKLVRELWSKLVEYMKQRSDTEVIFEYRNVMFNNISYPIRHINNTICLIFKQFLYKERCLGFGNLINFKKVVNYIKQIESIEKYNATVNGHITKHNIKWGIS